MAVPCKFTVCGEFDVLLATLTVPRWTFEIQTVGSLGENCPHKTSGENVTVAEQLEPWVIEPPQLSVTAKSPIEVMATLVAVARPVLVKVKVAGPDTVPTV